MKELTQERKNKYQNYNQDGLNGAFIRACERGQLEIIKYLLTSADLQEHADIHADHDGGFRAACENGHLELVSYLLTSPELTAHADIYANHNYGFRLACREGHLEIVKYLLTSPDLTAHADVHADHDYGFRAACDHGHLETVKYLLTSPDLVEYADIHADNDRSFKWACKVRNLEMVIYLLSFNREQCIDFQHTEYDLNWAINNQYNSVIIAMMNNLKNNNPLNYLEYLPKIEMYNTALYNEIQNIKIDNLEVNPQETVLFM